MSKEFDIRQYKERVFTEIKKEVDKLDPVKQRCRIVSFISRSAGRGRKRKERWVELFVVDDTYAHCISDNGIKPRQKRDRIAIDVLANEILTDLPKDERTVERLLERVRRW